MSQRENGHQNQTSICAHIGLILTSRMLQLKGHSTGFFLSPEFNCKDMDKVSESNLMQNAPLYNYICLHNRRE